MTKFIQNFFTKTIVASRLRRSKYLKKVWYRALPLLGVRRNITLLWQTLPERFQGLGMPNFVVVAFVSKVFFLQCHWGFWAQVVGMVL